MHAGSTESIVHTANIRLLPSNLKFEAFEGHNIDKAHQSVEFDKSCVLAIESHPQTMTRKHGVINILNKR